MLIPAEYINTLLCFAARDTLKQLDCIMVEVLKNETRLAATDGYILGVFRLASTDNLPPMTVNIPRRALDNLKPKRGELIEMLLAHDGKEATIKYGNTAITCKTTTFGGCPSYRRIIPATYTGELAQFSGELLAAIIKAYKCLHKGFNAPFITHNGTNAALIDLNCDDFCGVIMPLRFTGDLKDRTVRTSTSGWGLP